VFDALDKSAKTLDQLAAATGASPRGMRALLNGLVGTEFLVRRGEKYALTAESSAFLVKSKPTFMGGLLEHMSRHLVPSWMKLEEAVRTGRPATRLNQLGPGSEFFADFVEDIFSLSYPVARIAAEMLLKKVTKPTSVLDIAAGSGVWGIAMAQRSTKVSVTAVDWPDVIPVTQKVVARHKLADQFSFVEGDIERADLGNGHSTAILGHILHSEGEARSRTLLKRVFESLARGGTIVVAEFLPDEGRRGPAIPLIFAVNMLVNSDEGDTFTLKEIKSWLTEAGFRKVRTLDTPGPSPLILADKP
jgi:SAM-dependent methyltransferase